MKVRKSERKLRKNKQNREKKRVGVYVQMWEMKEAQSRIYNS